MTQEIAYVLDIAKFSNKICPIAACFIIEPSNKEQISLKLIHLGTFFLILLHRSLELLY